jgi:membrane-associated PAP2 superfamily phosphatase
MAKISIVLMVVIGFFGGMQTYNEVKNWWFDRKGQYWLVDDLWLNKPKAMSGKEIVVVIVSYLSLVSLLIGMMILLNKTPDSNFVEVLLK